MAEDATRIERCGIAINMLTSKMNMLYHENSWMVHEFNEEVRKYEARIQRLQDVNRQCMKKMLENNTRFAEKIGGMQIEHNIKLMNVQTESDRKNMESLYKIKQLSDKVENLELLLSTKNNQHNDNVELKQKYDIVTEKYNNLVVHQKINETKFEKMQDDHKELEMKYNDLKIKYDEMKQKHDYKSWDANMIVEWIMWIDISRYVKYKDILLINMNKERIDGTCLKDLDKNDLHRLGVEQFKDKRDLYEEIQQLVCNQIDNEQQEGENEMTLI